MNVPFPERVIESAEISIDERKNVFTPEAQASREAKARTEEPGTLEKLKPRAPFCLVLLCVLRVKPPVHHHAL
jgi:hypothetical protein